MHSTLSSLLFMFGLFVTAYGSGDWICYKTALGINSSELDDDIGEGYVDIDGDKCGEMCGSHSAPWIGYIGALIAVVFFGSNFVPVKQFDTGDGLFFQWILCIGIWIVGLIVNLARQQPPFFYPSLMGGFVWTFGNIFTVPIIKMIGLTMGLTIWGTTNLLAGWVSGKFILQGKLQCPPLNYGGVACVLLSTTVLAFVKSEGKSTKDSPKSIVPSERAPLINSTKVSGGNNSLSGSLMDKLLNKSSANDGYHSDQESNRHTLSFGNSQKKFLPGTEEQDTDFSWVDRLGKWPRRIIGFTLALFVGFFFGFQFLGVEFMRRCTDELHSCNELDYVFGHYTGILLSSTLWFVIYSVWMRNKPQVYPRLILPGLVSGIMWGIAMVGWFLANQHLSLAVSFPIVTAGPGFVSSALGILVFREIKGWRNIALYFGGFTITAVGLVMVGLSSCTHCKY